MNTLQLQSVLQSCLPACRNPSDWAPLLASQLGDMTSEQLSAFLAQVAVESNCLNRLAENLNYTAARLIVIWPKRFTTLACANEYAAHPEKLANRVYADRLGNGSEASGDGYRYRGRGLLQITGKANYRATEAALGLPLVLHPELLESRPVALVASLNFWNTQKLNELVGSPEQFKLMTRKINGGEHGLAERLEYWRRLRVALGVE